MKTALDRFAEKCAFDPCTGCVMWVGGTGSGQGHHERYGRFSDGGFKWWAHRWAAQYIHGHEITGMQVDHCCPFGPSTLCVQHVKPETAIVNRMLQWQRPGRAFQHLQTKKYWLLVTKGYEEYEKRLRVPADQPIYDAPVWLSPYLLKRPVEYAPF